MLKNGRRSLLGLYTTGIAALFLAGFLLLVVLGAQSYRNTVAGQERNMQLRSQLSYLSTAVRSCDSAGAVSIREDPVFGTVLTLSDGNSGYELRIYRSGVQLLEDYAPTSSALRPEEAQQIGETQYFEADWPAPRLLKISTDAGSVFLRMRSAEESP